MHISDVEAWCKISFENSDANPLSIAHHLYLNGTEVKDLVIPSSVISIGTNAFYGGSGLTSITIPKSVTSIGSAAFYGCRLENVLTKNTTTGFSDSFSDRTYRHAMLYIPIGSWSDAVYVGGWYQFYNIRETAMTTEALYSKQAYSLVDAETYDYIVYDPLNDDVALDKKFYNVDESNPDNAWQIVENNGLKYLYNIGAQQYATLSDKGNIVLTANAIPVTMTTTDDGIQLGTASGKKWLFVTNNDVNPD